MKELPIDEHPPLLIIDQSMLIRIIVQKSVNAEHFYDILSKILSELFSIFVVRRRQLLKQIVYQIGRKGKKRFGTNAGNQKSEKRKTPIPRQKIKYLSNQANMLNLADFVFCDLIEVSKDQLPDNSTVHVFV